MIREQQHWTPSELIDLFIDGEADDVQKSLLFTALANDAGLQAEFGDALRINAAIREAGLEECPPQHVTTALFKAAGFSAAAENTAVGGAVPASGRKGFLFYLRSLALPLLSAFIGGTIALLFAPEILRQSETPNATTLAAHTPTTQAAPDPHSRQITASTTDGKRTVGGIEGEESTARATRSGKEPHALQHIPTATLSAAKKYRHAETISEPTSQEATSANKNDGAGNRVIDREGNVHIIPDSAATFPQLREIQSPVEPIPAVPKPEAAAAPEPKESNDQSLALLQSATADHSTTFIVQEPRFAVQVRGMAHLELFPHRSLSTGEQTIFENIAFTGFYNISDNHSIGIEVGREYHPLYVPTTASVSIGGVQDQLPDTGGGLGVILNGTSPDLNPLAGAGSSVRTPGFATASETEKNLNEIAAPPPTTGFRLEPQAAWFGLAYQFRARPLDRLGLVRPYAQAMVGGTGIGPIGKGTIGLSWTPDSRVSFNLGLEGTAILYRNNNIWYSSRKLGLAYSAQINF